MSPLNAARASHLILVSGLTGCTYQATYNVINTTCLKSWHDEKRPVTNRHEKFNLSCLVWLDNY